MPNLPAPEAKAHRCNDRVEDVVEVRRSPHRAPPCTLSLALHRGYPRAWRTHSTLAATPTRGHTDVARVRCSPAATQ
jgi:hypothetical protein